MTTTYKCDEGKLSKDIAILFAEHLDLYAHGICEIATISDHYPLHKAVIDNDLPLVQRISVGERYT